MPKDSRLRRAGGELYEVHHQDLHDEQIGWWERVPIVSVRTAIEQCIDTGVPAYLMKQALDCAQGRGAINAGEHARLHNALADRND